jgi:pimeloyl-ACP methyl ester carboxylesterase
MITGRRVFMFLLSIGVLLLGLPTTAGAAPVATHYAGTLPNGSTWIADRPANWNGTLLIYSHGYIPGPALPAPQEAPNNTAADLLAQGYALAGSSYSRPGWALATAAADQLATVSAVQALIGPTRHVIAVGNSMGGLITGQLAERAGDRIDGALASCGLMVGGIDMHNAQLDGLYTLAQLLLPDQNLKLVRFSSIGEAIATVNTLKAAVDAAQATPDGRARIGLAAAFFHLPTWYTGQPKPADRDYAAQEVGQYLSLIGGAAISDTALFRYETGRFDVEQSAGGNPSWNKGVDYRRLLARSVNETQVKDLYRQAGLDLRNDLDQLTRSAGVTADPVAVQWMQRTSTLSGKIKMPVLTMHTTNDQLAPVQFQEEYAEDVRQAGRASLLRQVFVDHPGHCTYTTAELLAAITTISKRVETGRWDNTSAGAMQRLATSFTGEAAFIRFTPGEFLADRSIPCYR